MLVCDKPFNHIYLDKFDGKTWTCPWMREEYGVIGNLLENSAYDIWHGEKAKHTRELIKQGKILEVCRHDACPLIQNKSLPDLDGDDLDKISITRDTPATVNLAHDYTCNQHCETCRPFKFHPPKDYAKNIRTINEKIAHFIDKASLITLSGHGDPFASPYMMELMENMRPSSSNFSIHLETNGVFFDKKHWKKIEHLSQYNLEATVTVNSFDPYIYRQINRGGNYERLIGNLLFIKDLRTQNKLKKLFLTLVIQDKNFREMPAFIEAARNAYGCDLVFLRPVYQWHSAMTPDMYWFKDVLNPMHPYHKEYLEFLDHPSLNKPYVYNFGGRTLHPATPFPGHFPPIKNPYAKRKAK